jgi:hypothetical protein
MLSAIALLLALGWPQTAGKAAQPRISATDTAYLGCSAWTGEGWTPAITRTSRTTVNASPKGYRAYAEVKAVASGDACENTTRLYVTPAGGSAYKIAYTISPAAREGNGIRLIGWSPSGDKLLAEVNLWEYETDGGFDHVMLVYDAAARSAKVIHLDQAVSRRFGANCESELSIDAWKNEEQVLIKVSKSPEDESYKQHFCVSESRRFVFDLQKQALQADPEAPRQKN